MGSDEYFRCISTIRLDMLELMGSGYVVEHCVAAFAERCEKKAYRNYMADGIKCISETIANVYGGTYMENRLADLMDTTPEKTGDEIALEVITRAGLKLE